MTTQDTNNQDPLLPTYKECESKRARSLPMSPIECFIYAYEPSGAGDEDFRNLLAQVIRTPSPTPGKSDRVELLDRMAEALRESLLYDNYDDSYAQTLLVEYDTLRASPAESCAETAVKIHTNSGHTLSTPREVEIWFAAFDAGCKADPRSYPPTPPVAWLGTGSRGEHVNAIVGRECPAIDELDWEPLYTHPQPQTQPSAAGDAIRELVTAVADEFETPDEFFPDDEKVSYPEEECHITFGMIRRAQAALASSPPASLPDKSAVTDAMDFDRLLAIVEAAAPDPWTVRNDNEGEDPPRSLWVVENADMETPDDADNSPVPFQAAINYGARADADFIATFSPSMVRRLIERARTAPAASDEVLAPLDVYLCPACLQEQSKTASVGAGGASMSAGVMDLANAMRNLLADAQDMQSVASVRRRLATALNDYDIERARARANTRADAKGADK